MTESTFRALSEQERQVLRRLASGSADWANDLASGSFVFVLVFLVAMGLSRVLHLPRPQSETASAIGGIVLAVWTVTYMRRRSAGVRGREQYRRDLAEGAAEELTHEITDAIRVEEAEDEGSQYFLKLHDGRALFLGGQYLYEPEEARRFPCTRVRITRAPHSRLVLDIFCEGPYLEPFATRPAFSSLDYKRSIVPDDGDVLELKFEDLRTSAGCAAAGGTGRRS